MQFGLDPFTLVVTLISIVIGLTVHEMMHAFVGYKLGDTTAYEEGRISLNPLRHIDPFMTVLLPLVTLLLFHVPILAAKPVPFNPLRVKYDEFGAALIALAGPVSNLVLAVMSALLLRFGIFGDGALAQALFIFTILNIGLFVFNMIPIPPLDGSRVLYAVAPEGLQRVMAQLETFGIFIVFGLVLAVPAFSQLLININQSILRALLGV
jgi:Zn-dependent protease